MDQYIAAIEKQGEAEGHAPRTLNNHKDNFTLMWSALGKDTVDITAVSGYLAHTSYSAATKKAYTWAIVTALKGADASFSQVNGFEQLARGFSATVESIQEQLAKTVEKKEKLEEFAGEYKEPLQECITNAEAKIAKGTYESTYGERVIHKAIKPATLASYRAFVIDCKIRVATVPTRSDLRNVYASKEKADAAGGDCYYDSCAGKIIFGSRVKDPHRKKESPDFDVSAIKAELDEYIKHGHAKLLGIEKSHKGYCEWVGAMTKVFNGKGIRMGPTFQRALFWNQPEKKAVLEETCSDAAMCGHTPQTAHKHYRNPLVGGKENGTNFGIDVEENDCQSTNSDDTTEPPAKRICSSPVGYAPTTPRYTDSDNDADDSSEIIPKICVCWGSVPSCTETGKCNIEA